MKGKELDLTDIKFGRLTAVRKGSNHKTQTRWECLCDCGNSALVTTQNLRNGSTKSCGCYKKECDTLHGHSNPGGTPSYTYMAWTSMHLRCKSDRPEKLKRYKNRGISVCAEWQNFKNFLRDMGEKPQGLYLDRIDNNKGYDKNNCRWVTPKESVKNRECTISINYRGAVKTLKEWCILLNVPYSRVRRRYVSKKWSVHDMFTQGPRW
jgi:hypothetical protein